MEMHNIYIYSVKRMPHVIQLLLEIQVSGKPVSPFELCCLSSLCLELIAEETERLFCFSFWSFLIQTLLLQKAF